MSDKKCMFGTKNDHFLMLCHEGQWDPPMSTFSFAPSEVGGALCSSRGVFWIKGVPDNPRSAARRAAEDLVV